ncbi:serine hydrolase domain-containing protein [Leptolyngbya ohadii]|uniref:serine hydrolase domain-containing protein n=1 Tax=Leptolyngbya ohadii TaxID=1962290 RepID=UPI00117BCD30|nr:serine hydrolase domain-containing protein [Leptolyngbya ohadii]
MTDLRDLTNLRETLSTILNNKAQDRDVAGVAVVLSPGMKPEAVWHPGSNAAEPAFLAYSITKTFTAVLLLLLQEEGLLNLEDPLVRWFPTIDRADYISLRQLLNHTAGIPDYGGLRDYHEAVRATPSIPWSFEQFAAMTFDRGLSFAPGSGWAYSNPGYLLLKQIAEAVTGISYRDLIHDRIIRPLGLRRTFVPESIEDLASLMLARSRFLATDGTPRDVRHFYHPGWVSHGVIASTPSEIALFLSSLFGDRLLPRPSLDEMMELVPVPIPEGDRSDTEPLRWVKPSYGLGLMADPASAWGTILGHNGGGPGYSASVFYAPDLGGITVCAMSAVEEGLQAEEIVFAVLDWIASPSAHSSTR